MSNIILDKIVARKKEEVAELLSSGPGEPPEQVEPPRGLIKSLLELFQRNPWKQKN